MAEGKSVNKVIGIHFRTGDGSKDRWKDPKRHGRDELLEFFGCAEEVERRLGYDPLSTRWFLAADADVETWDEVQLLYLSRKLVGPRFGNFSNAIVHLDRSSLSLLAVGTT